MIDHNVMRFNVTVHYTLTVAEVQSLTLPLTPFQSSTAITYLKELQDIEADIVVHKLGVQTSKIRVVDIFEDQ